MSIQSSEAAVVAAAAAPVAPPVVAAPTMSRTEWGLLIVLSMLWGGAFFLSKVALAEVTPLALVAARVGVAAVALWAVVLAKGLAVPREGRLWRDYLVLALINNVAPFCLLAYGQQGLPSGLAAILNASTPLWTVLLAHVTTLDERATGGRLAGVAVGMVGVAVIIGPRALEGVSDALLPALCIVGAAMCYAAAIIYARRFRGRPPLITAASQLGLSSVIMVAALLAFEGAPALPSPHVTASLMVFGLFSTALGFVIYFRILAGAGSTNAALVTFLVPVSSILLGALVLGERLDAREFVGMGAIALGLAAIDGRPWRALKRGVAS
ncbi:DMT family transporter [Methylopila sp. 73B]|uniref:DMT family transporter n=1 Tax=Methylopila sp. 73B TaxID=1120792 RepID=UPI000379E2F8|nr:DMT family transporter [Methylopila sp. 73B]